MKTLLKISLLLSLLIGISSGTWAQEAWTLEACVNQALQHNLNLNDMSYSVAAQQERYRQSFREMLPTVSANTNYNVRYGRSVDPNTNEIVSTDFFSNNYSVDANWLLFQGFQRKNTTSAERFLYQALKEETLQQKYLLAFRVMNAYFDLQFAKNLVENANDQVQISTDNYNLVKKQIDLGLMAAADLLEAESALIADRLRLTQGQNNLLSARLRLMQEMNLEEREGFDIEVKEDLEAALMTIDVDSVYNRALQVVPQVQAQELRVKAAEKQVKVAQGRLYPALFLGTGYGTGYFETNVDATESVISFRQQIKDNASQYIGASLRIPISERWSNRSEVKQRKIALLRAMNQLELQQQTLNQVIQDLVQEYSAAQVTYVQTQQSEAAQLLAFNVAQKRYERGLIDILSLSQSKTNYANAQNGNLQAKQRLSVLKKTLDFYMGLPVFNIKKTYTTSK